MMNRVQFDPIRHRYTDDSGAHVPGVTSVIVRAGLIDTTWYTEESANRGKAVAAATHYDDEGELDNDSVTPLVAGYLAGWRRFRAESDLKILAAEEIVFHPHHRYAGTVDRHVRLHGREAVLDIKTGGPLPAHGIQLAAYALAISPLIRLRRFAVYLTIDGAYRVREYASANDAGVFLSCLAISNWKASNGYPY
jgi:hypothetical protein